MSSPKGQDLLPPRATDERGRLLPLTPEQLEARRKAAFQALEAVERIGDPEEQR